MKPVIVHKKVCFADLQNSQIYDSVGFSVYRRQILPAVDSVIEPSEAMVSMQLDIKLLSNTVIITIVFELIFSLLRYALLKFMANFYHKLMNIYDSLGHSLPLSSHTKLCGHAL